MGQGLWHPPNAVDSQQQVTVAGRTRQVTRRTGRTRASPITTGQQGVVVSSEEVLTKISGIATTTR